MGVMVDQDTGYPLIKKGHELACEAYCVYKMYYEDWLTNKIDTSRWSFIVDTMRNLVDASSNGLRHKDRKDLEKINRIHGQIFMRPGYMTLYDFQFNKKGNF
jgi:hypothetical protein